MSTRILTGTYASGYAPSTPTTLLSIAASGYVGGTGVATASTATSAYTVINDGRINATSSSDIAGIYLAHGGTVTNDAAGKISGYRGVEIQGAAGVVTNYGAIYGGPGANAIALRADGVVTNGNATDTTALIKGYGGVGLRYAAGYLSDAVMNFGTIEATAAGYIGVSMPAGTLANGSSNDPTALIEGYYGVISGSAAASKAQRAVFTVVNFGTILGSTSGRYGVGLLIGGGGSVTNGSASDHVALIEGYTGLISRAAYALTLTNYGSIVGKGGGYGVDVNACTIINGSTGDESALISGATGIELQGSPATILNFGTIQGTGTTQGGWGVFLGSSDTLTNGSATDAKAIIEGGGGVSTGFGATITNFGTIIGTSGTAMSFFSGSTLIVEAGSKAVGMVVGYGATLELASGKGTITGLGATGTLSGAASMTFTSFGAYAFHAGSSTTFKGANTLGGVNSFGVSQTLTVAGAITIGGTLSSAGTMSVSGSIGGTGTLVVTGGLFDVRAGAGVSVTHWMQTGGVVALNESLAVNGGFRQSAGAEVSIAAGDRLSLNGATVLDGTISGPGTVSVGKATVNGVDLTNAVTLQVSGAVAQSGVVTVGDSNGGASVSILKTGAWDIGVGSITSTALSAGRAIDDFGLLVKNAGTGVSSIGVTVLDDAVVEAAVGTLDLMQGVTGTGTLKIDAGATLEVDATASKTLTATFNGASATLALKAPTSFAATIAGFAPTDTIHLLGLAATGASINASDQLVIVNGATTVATLKLSGTYSGATFSVVSDKHGGAGITLVTAAQVPPPSPSLMAAAIAAMAPSAGMANLAHDPGPLRAPLLARPHTQTQ